MGRILYMPARIARFEMESETDAARRRALVAQMNDRLRVRMVQTRLGLLRGIEAMRAEFRAARPGFWQMLFGK